MRYFFTMSAALMCAIGAGGFARAAASSAASGAAVSSATLGEAAARLSALMGK